MSYDKFNSNYEDIYQVNIGKAFYTAAPLANLMKESIPELRSVTRIYPGSSQAPFMEVDENGGSFATLISIKPTGRDMDSDWANWLYYTFALLDNDNSEIVEEKISKLWKELESIHFAEDEHQEIGVVSLSDIPFHNNNKRQLIFLIQLVGIFILILALVNFVNLTIARSSLRAREIAVRKVNGSSRFELIKQFLFESVLISILVAPVSLLIVSLSGP